MARRGKRVRAFRAQIDRTERVGLNAAFEIVKKHASTKFDESVDIAVKLGVNPRHADQMVRGACLLPHGTGKTVRVLVFAKGDKATEAEQAGADFVGADDLVEKIKGGWTDFDRVIATPDMMGVVGKVGRILGPRGLMPNPKVGTVTFEVANAVSEARAGKIDFRVEKAGIIHAPLGRASFDAQKLQENAMALIDTLMKLKPATAKGAYVRGITVSSTQGPGVPVDHVQLQTEMKS